jgi:hypothetical protein
MIAAMGSGLRVIEALSASDLMERFKEKLEEAQGVKHHQK